MSGIVQAVRGLVSRFVRVVSSLGAVRPAMWLLPLVAMVMALGVAPQSASAQSISALNRDTVYSQNGGDSWLYLGGGFAEVYNDGAGNVFVARASFSIPAGQTYTDVNLSFSASNFGGVPTTVTFTAADTVDLNAANSGTVIRSGATYGSIAVGAVGGGVLGLNATAIQRMNTISQAGGGTFFIGITGPASGDYYDVELFNLTLSSVVSVPTVTSISPTSGPSTGGTTVTLTGTSFTNATAVTFGATAATGYTVNSATQITATAPAGTGTVNVRVVNPAGTSPTGAANQYTYLAAPTVTSISPTAGSSTGGTTVTLTGTNFSGTTAVTFGATAATGYTVNSATQITATAPAGTGTVDIRVTTAGGTSATSAADQYTYVGAPTVSSITPTAGPSSGGTTVTITGTNFSGATAVTFGATNATGFTVNSATSITATAPAGTGTVNVRITTAGGTSATGAANQYTYVAAPTVTAAYSSTTVTVGGTQLLIVNITNPNVGTALTGISLAPAALPANVTFSNLNIGTGGSGFPFCSGAVFSGGALSVSGQTLAAGASCQATLIARPDVVGTYSYTTGVVSATGPASLTGATATTSPGLTALPAAPAVTFLGPNSGSTAGGTPVTIMGTGFTGATAVSFGGTPATNFAFQSDTMIIATSPAGTGGVNVTVTTSGGTSAAGGANTYTYVAAPTVSSVSPAEGIAHATNRPANVTITGTNFSASGNSVNFGGTPGTIVSESTTSIVVTPPANATGGLVNVDVFNSGGQFGAAVNAYRYLLPPTVTVSWSPDTITTSQPTTFTVTLTNPNAVAIQNVSVASTSSTPFFLTAFGTFCGSSGNYNASAAFNLNGVNLAAGASCTATTTQQGGAGVHQFVTTAPTSTGTAATAVTLTGVGATSNTITVYGAPSISSVSPNNGPLVGGQAITLTGANFTAATAVTIDGVAATNVTVVSATSITATTPAGASTGSKTVRVTGPGGTGTRTNFYTYNAAPTSPVILSPAQGGATATLPVYSGTFTNSGSTITVFVDGASIGTVTPGSGTAWSLQQPTALTGGAHTVHVTATTTSGGVSAPSATTNFTVDTTAPAAPTIVQPFLHTNNPVVILTGTAEANSTVTITEHSNPFAVTTANGSGAWTYNAGTLADAAYQFRATATDAAGNISPSSVTMALTVDTVAPPAATITSPVDGLLTSGSPTFSGTAEPFAMLNLRFNGDSYVSGVQANASGVWSFSFGNPGLGNGTYVFSVGVADLAGNAGPDTTGPTFTVDRAAPAAPVVTSPVEGSFRLARDVTLTGTAEANATISITGSYTGTATADGSGAWSVQLPAVSADGAVSVNVTATDATGNVSPATTRSWTIDTTTPAAPAIATPFEGQAVNARNLLIQGTTDPFATVSVQLDGAAAATFAADGSGAFSYTINNVADGPHTLRGSATDRAGNAGPLSALRSFTLDATAPAFPVLTSPAPNGTTGDSTPALAGTAEAGNLVTLYLDDTFLGQATADGSGGWTIPVTTPLADGSHQVKLMALDPSFNSSGLSGAIFFTVDVTAPTAPAISAPANGSATTDNTPTITGTAEAGSTATITVDGAVVGSATTDGSGAWSLTSAALADGSHTVSVVSTDAVGNTSSPSTVISFTVDATAPASPTVASPTNGSILSDTTPTISGSAEAGSSVAVTIDGASAGTVTADGSGGFSFTPAALADGSHTVSVIATDALGNASAASTAITFTIDAAAPTAPVIGAPADGSVTDDGTPVISGSAEAGSTVQLIINGAAPVSVTASGGTWSYTPASSLPAGQNTLSAIAVDAAGNASPASVTVRFTYSPVTITTSSLPSGQVGVAYAATIQVSGGTGPHGFAVTTGVLPDGVTLSSGGALSGTPTASGTFAFTVRATDANGLSTSQAYSVPVAQPADPVVTDVSDVQVTANPGGSGDPTMIDLSGAVQNATRIEIVTPPAHGTATVNGFEVTYMPEAGYFGPDSFTYRAVGFDDGVNGPTAAKDGSPASAVSQPATVSIIIAAPTLALTGGAQPSGQIGAAYNQVLTTSGGTAPYAYAVTGGALPAGITLATDGTLSGSPTAGGTFSFTVTATDSSTGTGPFSISAAHQLTIDAPALTVTPSALPNATTAQAYSQTFSTTGGVAPYSYAVTAGALPTGLTLSSAGVLSGTATQGGVFNFTVSATDASTGAGPYTAAQPVTLTVTASTIAVTPASLASGTRGTPYAASMAASGGVAPYSYAIASGALPAGLTLSTTGQISGTPTVVGTFAFQVRATDSATGAGPYAGVVDVTLTIGAASLTVTPATLPDVLAGVDYSQQLQASGGRGGYSFAVTAGVLPQGLTLSPAGLLSGTPTTAGTFAFTVTATDSFGNTGLVALTVTVIGRPDPSADPDVRGLNTAQAEAARRMVGTQLSNFGRRLEQLHGGGEGQAGATMNLTLDGSAFTPLDEGRQTMGELSQARGRDDQDGRDQSGRDELNRMVWGDRAEAPASGGSSRDGLNAGPQGGADGSSTSGPRIWAGGAISLGERDATTQTAEMSITTSGISAGVDMSMADNLDLGIGVGFGQENTDVGVDSSRMEADSRVAVAYGSWRPAVDVFIDGILGYGEMGFDMRRRTPVDQSLVFGQRDGTATFGSLSAGLDRSTGPARWISYGRVELLNADLDAYVETGSPLWALDYEARSVESLQGALGLRYERDILRGHDRWIPGVRVEWTHEFGDAAAQTLRYADWLDGPGFSIGQEGWDRSRFNLGLSLGWRARDGWSWTGEYDGAFSNGEILNGLRIKGSRAF